MSLCKDPNASKKDDPKKDQDQGQYNKDQFPQPKDLEKEKWGDQRVGRHNGGVNGEEGLDGHCSVGCASLVELGAGSLRKVSPPTI